MAHISLRSTTHGLDVKAWGLRLRERVLRYPGLMRNAEPCAKEDDFCTASAKQHLGENLSGRLGYRRGPVQA